VIGGVYSYSTSESHSGIPFLKDIPIVGWLFRSYYNPVTDKKELIIFLSPRVINQEEAGLTDKG
jgi:type IV pilus assembly protein PilQ